MKRLIIFLLTTILIFSLVEISNASNIDILPTMQSKSNVQDRVWAGTFQLVWNDLIDKVAFGSVRFADGTPEIAQELNKRSFESTDISLKSYYKYVGKITKNTKAKIEKAILRKFDEKSDILDKLDWTPARQRYVLYAMLKKDFEFTQPFDKLGRDSFRDMTAEYFGINSNSDNRLGEGVTVLFYNSPNDFAISLSTMNNDEVFLYKTNTTKPFNYIYSDMLKKSSMYEGDKEFQNIDELKVPNLKFFEEKEFNDLTFMRIKGTQLMIDKAIETVKFEMNNKGVRLKSEAAITTRLTSANPSEDSEPRYFYLDDTFVLFLKEKEKSKPYFALRVYDISKFE